MGRLTRIRTALKILWRNRRNVKRSSLVDVTFVAGMLTVASGIGAIYGPAGVIFLGASGAALAWRVESGAPPELSPRERELIAQLRESGESDGL